MRIGPRLVLNAVLIATFSVIATVLLIGAMSYNYGKNILEDSAKDRLTLVRDLKADEIRRYVSALQRQCILFSNDPAVIQAMKDLKSGFDLYAKEVSLKGMDKYKDEVIKHYIQEFSRDYANDNGGIPFDATPYLNVSNPSTFALQYNYIFNNQYGIDKEQTLTYIDDGSTYSRQHAKYHPQLRDLKVLFGMEDIFLVDPNGDIVYTVAKGLDFTTSLINGPYANTVLGQVFREANTDDGRKRVPISDFAAYSPSNDDQASFIATPIFDNGQKVGVLIFQISAVVLDAIMTSDRRWDEIGLGKSGEAYIVDKEGRMITNSRFELEDPEKFYQDMTQGGLQATDSLTRMRAKQNNMGLIKADTLGVQEVLAGKSGFAIYKGYKGKEVLGSYEPLDIAGVNWGVVAEIDKAEAFAPVYSLAKRVAINLAGIMVLIIAFATIVGIGLARQISAPIEKLSGAIKMLAETRDLTKRIKYPVNDEIGDMTNSINQLLDSFQKTHQETVLSSQKMQTTAHKLLSLAEEIDNREALHKFEDNYESVHEKTSELKNAGDNLNELSDRLQALSRQFKVFEEEADRTKDW